LILKKKNLFFLFLIEKSLRGDGPLTIPYIEVNGSHWHLDCCQCVLCSKSLVGRESYRKGYSDKLYCSEECCWRE
jgi:hypothetical protein